MRLITPKVTAIAAIVTLILLSACANGPVTPDWQMNAKSSIEHATTAYLSGNDRVEVQEFTNARSAMASTGQIALVAHVELIRCATRVASLVMEDCTGFEKLRADTSAADRAYADYLAGHAQPQDIALLPAQHVGVMSASTDSAAAAVAAITDPLSRLVAAGVLLRSNRANPKVLQIAVGTASEQGWRRPLLAWLNVQAMRAEQAGDATEAQRLRRRIALVQEANHQ